MTILGLDLSLTRTGWAQVRDGALVSTGTHTTKTTGLQRITTIAAVACLEVDGVTAVAVEGPSYNSRHGSAHERGGLWWMTVDRISDLGVPVYSIPPASLKAFATGKGNAAKGAMIAAAVRQWPEFGSLDDDNVADAAWLAAMLSHHLGEPVVSETAYRAKAIEKLSWEAVK